MKKYSVYILSSRKNGTLYVGVTNNIVRRIYEHQQDLIDGFTKKYNIKNLVYVENYLSIYDALVREKRIKNWPRAWKIELIEKHNSEWKDLSKLLIEDI